LNLANYIYKEASKRGLGKDVVLANDNNVDYSALI
jgi:hypothetical protein